MKKIIFSIAAFAGGYFIVKAIAGQTKFKGILSKQNDDEVANFLNTELAPEHSFVNDPVNDDPLSARVAPLVFGSRGEAVRILQLALMKFDQAKDFVVNTGGADGILGKGTTAAIESIGYQLPLSQDQVKDILQKSLAANQKSTEPTAIIDRDGTQLCRTSNGYRPCSEDNTFFSAASTV